MRIFLASPTLKAIKVVQRAERSPLKSRRKPGTKPKANNEEKETEKSQSSTTVQNHDPDKPKLLSNPNRTSSKPESELSRSPSDSPTSTQDGNITKGAKHDARADRRRRPRRREGHPLRQTRQTSQALFLTRLPWQNVRHPCRHQQTISEPSPSRVFSFFLFTSLSLSLAISLNTLFLLLCRLNRFSNFLSQIHTIGNNRRSDRLRRTLARAFSILLSPLPKECQQREGDVSKDGLSMDRVKRGGERKQEKRIEKEIFTARRNGRGTNNES